MPFPMDSADMNCVYRSDVVAAGETQAIGWQMGLLLGSRLNSNIISINPHSRPTSSDEAVIFQWS